MRRVAVRVRDACVERSARLIEIAISLVGGHVAREGEVSVEEALKL